jgi:hypothetical protein
MPVNIRKQLKQLLDILFGIFDAVHLENIESSYSIPPRIFAKLKVRTLLADLSFSQDTTFIVSLLRLEQQRAVFLI